MIVAPSLLMVVWPRVHELVHAAGSEGSPHGVDRHAGVDVAHERGTPCEESFPPEQDDRGLLCER